MPLRAKGSFAADHVPASDDEEQPRTARRAPDRSRLAPTEQQAGPRRVSIALRDARSHAHAHGHGCPSALAMQHSGGADVTVALHR
jgi:hypothetical protein